MWPRRLRLKHDDRSAPSAAPSDPATDAQGEARPAAAFRRGHLNSYPGLVRLKDRVVYDVGGYQRYGIVEAFLYRGGRSYPSAAAVQPALGGPRRWIDLDLLTPVSVQ